jgi:hypothetical protein
MPNTPQPEQPIIVPKPDVVRPPTPLEEPQPEKGPDLPQPGPDVVVPPGPEVITPPQPQEIAPAGAGRERRDECTALEGAHPARRRSYALDRGRCGALPSTASLAVSPRRSFALVWRRCSSFSFGVC